LQREEKACEGAYLTTVFCYPSGGYVEGRGRLSAKGQEARPEIMHLPSSEIFKTQPDMALSMLIN